MTNNYEDHGGNGNGLLEKFRKAQRRVDEKTLPFEREMLFYLSLDMKQRSKLAQEDGFWRSMEDACYTVLDGGTAKEKFSKYLVMKVISKIGKNPRLEEEAQNRRFLGQAYAQLLQIQQDLKVKKSKE